MASKQPEIIRTLGDGLVVAWDTNVVSNTVRKDFADVAKEQADLLVRTILEDDGEAIHVVEITSVGDGQARPGKDASKGNRVGRRSKQ
jgi:hypothetical protein